MIQGFKDFITRGNVIDLAVAVIIGAAFTAIVTAVVDNLVNPLIGALVPSGNLAEWVIPIPGIFATANFGIGAIISAIINFLAVAAVVYFLLIVPMNKMAERRAARLGVQEEPEPAAPTQEELLAEIRDLLAARNQA
ncbi:large conductance mechanosensitive channel protein MscL [Microbacterium sp. MEC084]|jgi:large conductance mechanosensitive channel|uniref:large conductance mechanosensitive channel protein MscL n=1 Tax=unclassified Microbacterium TaxID=2609290 RepID=UPI0006F5DC34|nr:MULTISPECIES: large conductance mechanosensitive channel protein MscL [unclassified Microbacterium]KQZ06055.1 mechanosensitive ion channel protein MscL [Microbacterium sp. Root53]MCD1268912.1 large conductance mechanosensitive channel protein MscL [Microbacterium sp. MEC084]